MTAPWPSDDMSNEDMLIAVEKIKNSLVARATGETVDEAEYQRLRRQVLAVPELKARLPRFIESGTTPRKQVSRTSASGLASRGARPWGPSTKSSTTSSCAWPRTSTSTSGPSTLSSGCRSPRRASRAPLAASLRLWRPSRTLSTASSPTRSSRPIASHWRRISRGSSGPTGTARSWTGSGQGTRAGRPGDWVRVPPGCWRAGLPTLRNKLRRVGRRRVARLSNCR